MSAFIIETADLIPWGHLFAFICGGSIGFLVAASLAAGDRADDQTEQYEQIKRSEP